MIEPNYKTERLIIALTKEEKERLKNAANGHRLISPIVRAAITEYLDKHEKKRKTIDPQ